MKRFIEGEERTQITLLHLDDYIAEAAKPKEQRRRSSMGAVSGERLRNVLGDVLQRKAQA